MLILLEGTVIPSLPRAWAHDLSWASKCPPPGIWIFHWKCKELIHPDSGALKNFPLVFVPWSSQRPWGWSFLRPVYLTFLQLLCAAPCHSNKFLFYHWVSLNNFCCLPPKNAGKDSGIQTTVWPAELVGQQPSPLAKKPLILTCEERVTLRSNKFRPTSAHGWTLARKLVWQLPKMDWGNVRTELLVNHCLSPNYEALSVLNASSMSASAGNIKVDSINL